MSCAGLVLLGLLTQAPPPRVDLQLAFVYGYGSRSSFGGALDVTVGWPVWERGGAAGTLEAGLLAGYQNEPYSQTAAALAPLVVTGSNHRVEVFAVAGHTVRFPSSGRLSVGLQLFAGWTQLAMRGSLTDAARGVSGSYRADAADFTFGLLASVGVRVSDRVSIVARGLVPVPYAGIAVSSYFMVSLGASLRL